MVTRSEMDLQFLDLHDLTDKDKHEILTILRSETTSTLKLPWDATENNNSNVNPAIVTEVPAFHQQHWYNAMPPTQTYSQQMMTQLCNDWQASMYNVSTNGHMPFVSGLTYHPGYNLGVEMQDVNYGRENGRRNNRSRGMRRDYNRAINSTNEMQSGYMGDQAQFHPQIHPIMYIYSDHHSVSTQQHQVAAGQIYYPPPMYSSILHPHPNAQPISSNSHAQPTYPPNPPQMEKCMQQSQPVPLEQSNQETIKQPIIKVQDKHVQSTNIDKPICHQVEDNHNSLQTNVIATIVNNSTPESVNMDENTANKKIIASSENDVKVPHSVAWTENCNGMQIDVCISTNNDVEMNQSGEMNKIFQNETASNVTTIVTKTSPKSVSKAEKNEINIEENVILKDAQNNNNVEHKILNGSAATSNDSVMPKAPSPMSVSTSSTSSTTTIPRSYASLLKKDSTETQPPTSCKPTIHIIDQNNLSKMPTQKESTSLNSTPKNQNDSSSTSNVVNDYKTLQNGMLQNCYDDPNSYRIGEFLSSYQMDKQTVSLLPRGLTNRSNYCYINSILQALLACPPFYNLLKAMPLPKNRGKNSATPLIDNMVKFVREFTPLTEAARMPRKDRVHNKRGEDTVIDIHSGVAFEPSYIYTMLKHTSAAGAFSVEGRQEDAEEFLSCLLNGINDEMLEVMGPKNKGAVTRCTEFGRTPLSDIFRGQLRSRVSRAGEQPTDNVQPFFTLQLDVQKAESVKNALEILVGKDQVEGMTCSKTRQQIEAWKQVTLEELPVILILHLKWFVYKFDKYSNGCSKILKSMEFPVDLKIDGKFLSPNTVKKLGPKQKQYKLFAVTYHDGKEATKGHYITDAFHIGYGSWVRYDDSAVKSVPESNVLRPTSPRVPYLLYYRRCDTIGNQLSSTKTH
ncbi:Ubiquitin carboxyl-terminal hydrolase 10 [Camponotus floridanus]|uniref:ubiquitinyl hydrolase 1 n=1 Tax=Camponotus floridanus TaxID=104421 RepID=E2A9K8_CAMFO|nr:Ubiquitin carboxyl-terminal hydrolase 10 [Camponotus floridanus]